MTDLGSEQAALPSVLKHEARRVLAIPVGMGRQEFALARLAAVRNQPGWIVRAGTVSPWRVEGFFPHEGRLYLYGPYLPGRLLHEQLAAAERPSERPAGLGALSALTAALLTLKEHDCLPDELQSDAVCFLEDGGVLFLPPPLMSELRSMRPDAHRLATYQNLNHPDLRGRPEQLSFSLAALLYRLLQGGYPFQAATEEELRDRMRYQKLPSLTSAFPGLRQEIAGAILQGLCRAEGPPPTLEQWSALLAEANARGLYRPLASAEREALASQARAEAARAGKSYDRRVFWRKHWKTALIVAAAAALLGGVGGSLLKNFLAPPLTRGLGPRQVVESFYGGLNSLDHALMEDCVVDKAGRETIREVTNLYVLSRVSLGYEGKSRIVNAEQWTAQGRPQLDAADSVYGVTDLVIREERGQPAPVYLAGYTKWFPTPEPEGQSARAQAPRYDSQSIRERLYLRQERRDWVIYRIERL